MAVSMRLLVRIVVFLSIISPINPTATQIQEFKIWKRFHEPVLSITSTTQVDFKMESEKIRKFFNCTEEFHMTFFSGQRKVVFEEFLNVNANETKSSGEGLQMVCGNVLKCKLRKFRGIRDYSFYFEKNDKDLNILEDLSIETGCSTDDLFWEGNESLKNAIESKREEEYSFFCNRLVSFKGRHNTFQAKVASSIEDIEKQMLEGCQTKRLALYKQGGGERMEFSKLKNHLYKLKMPDQILESIEYYCGPLLRFSGIKRLKFDMTDSVESILSTIYNETGCPREDVNFFSSSETRGIHFVKLKEFLHQMKTNVHFYALLEYSCGLPFKLWRRRENSVIFQDFVSFFLYHTSFPGTMERFIRSKLDCPLPNILEFIKPKKATIFRFSRVIERFSIEEFIERIREFSKDSRQFLKLSFPTQRKYLRIVEKIRVFCRPPDNDETGAKRQIDM